MANKNIIKLVYNIGSVETLILNSLYHLKQKIEEIVSFISLLVVDMRCFCANRSDEYIVYCSVFIHKN